MIAITAYYRREAELKAQVDDLQRQLDNARTDWLCGECNGRGCEAMNQNAALLAELEEQARLNGKGSEREAALLAKVETLQREHAALESLIIKAGYIITNFNGEMALCRDPWHQPKEEQP
jgi:cell division protein FtsB